MGSVRMFYGSQGYPCIGHTNKDGSQWVRRRPGQPSIPHVGI